MRASERCKHSSDNPSQITGARMPRELREADIVRACAAYRKSHAEISRFRRVATGAGRAALKAAAQDARKLKWRNLEIASCFTDAGRLRATSAPPITRSWVPSG